MLGLDTNVLVRFLVRDDASQFAAARRVVGERRAAGELLFVSLLVLLETEWVLRSRYGLDKKVIAHTIDQLLAAAEVVIEDGSTVEEALFEWKDAAADFADCLIGARNRRAGCRATVTFDTRAARLPGFV
ncbi:MAG TPA: type II toxin-antitoxin system VapC family toxin, partial [Casimicrobiaceae bacterium]|nr:type II toxin-antitoxin system VapC family toxin [Casimicrobiaceae bacterium]